MTLNELNLLLENKRNGTYTKAIWSSYPLKSGPYKNRIKKVTSGVVRIGINFSHLSENQGKQTGPLNYGYWQRKNVVIENVDKNNVVSHLVRLYPSNCKNHKKVVEWYFDDKLVSSEWLIENGYAKQEQLFKPNSAPFLCFNVKLENLISLG